MKLRFKEYHPLCEAFFYILCIVFTAISRHPLTMVISLCASILFHIINRTEKMFSFFLKVILPIILITTFINLLFNHYGVTVLFSLRPGFNVTLEVVMQDILLCLCFASITLWFKAFSDSMGFRKLSFLFSGWLSSIGMILVLAMRFIPAYISHALLIGSSVRGEYMVHHAGDKSKRSLKERFHEGSSILASLFDWSLESSIETADSLNSRGFSLKGRTIYHDYSWTFRETICSISFTLILVLQIISLIHGSFDVRYNPVIKFPVTDVVSVSGFISFGVLVLIPSLIDAAGAIKWKRLMSRL